MTDNRFDGTQTQVVPIFLYANDNERSIMGNVGRITKEKRDNREEKKIINLKDGWSGEKVLPLSFPLVTECISVRT